MALTHLFFFYVSFTRWTQLKVMVTNVCEYSQFDSKTKEIFHTSNFMKRDHRVTSHWPWSADWQQRESKNTWKYFPKFSTQITSKIHKIDQPNFTYNKHRLHASQTAPMKWLRVNIQEHKSQFNTINNNTRLTCRVSESREADNGSTAGIKVTDPVTDLVLRVTSGRPSSSPKSIFTTPESRSSLSYARSKMCYDAHHHNCKFYTGH